MNNSLPSLFDQPTPNKLIPIAEEYVKYNFSVLPAKEDKSPMVSWAIYQQERMKNGAINKNFMNAHSLGIICGKVSENLEVIDIDCKYDLTGKLADDFFELVKDNLPDVFEGLLLAKTRNDGWHIYYRCPNIEGSKKLAVNSKGQVLIETRGEGGYVIAPPSPGYTITQGNFDKIPVITSEERDVLFAISKTFDEKPQIEPQEYSGQVNKNNGLSPFDDYNQRADVVSLLVQNGWQISKESGDRVHLTRQGKSKGISGNWHKIKRTFFVFSSSTQFEPMKGYNAVGVYCLLECNNDFSEASRKLYDAGYGEGKTNKQVAEKIEKQNEPIPLLPIEGFPLQIQNLINTCISVYRTPRDFWASSVIAATALAIGNKLELKGKYDNIPIFWICIVGDVSSGKTEPQKLLLRPFQELDDESNKRFEAELKEYERIAGLTKKEREAEGIEINEKPTWFQYRVKDATPEALAAIHEVNRRGIIIDREELKGWLDDFGRYNNSGEQSNMLSTWIGVSYISNRKSSKPINISNPVINVLGGMQPDILPLLAKDNRAENGFISRMCFAYPDNSLKQYYEDSTIPHEAYEEWRRFIRDLISMPETVALQLTNEASAMYKNWYDKNAQLTNNEPVQHLKGVYGKLDIIVLRLAIVIKGMKLMMEGDCEETISAEIMKSAIEITEYFRATALKVYNKMFSGEKKKIEKADVIQWVLSNLQKSKSEVARFFETSRSQVDRIEDKNQQQTRRYMVHRI